MAKKRRQFNDSNNNSSKKTMTTVVLPINLVNTRTHNNPILTAVSLFPSHEGCPPVYLTSRSLQNISQSECEFGLKYTEHLLKFFYSTFTVYFFRNYFTVQHSFYHLIKMSCCLSISAPADRTVVAMVWCSYRGNHVMLWISYKSVRQMLEDVST